MIFLLRFKISLLVLFAFLISTEVYSKGCIIPTDTSQKDFLHAYGLVLSKSYSDYRFTGSTLDTMLFPRWGEFSVYWIKSGSSKGSFVMPEPVPSNMASVTSKPYDSYDWKQTDHYSIQFKHDTKRVAIFRSLLKTNNNSISWEALYFKNTFDSYLYDNMYYFVNEQEIDTAGIYISTEVLIIPAFAANGNDDKFYIDSIFASMPHLKAKLDEFLKRGGNIYAEGNAVYFLEKLGYLPDSSVDFSKAIESNHQNNLLSIKFRNSSNPIAFTELAVGDTLYAGSVPKLTLPGEAEVIAEIPGSTPVAFVMRNVNGGRIICNTGLPTIGGINEVRKGSRQLQWTLNAIFYAFTRNIDVNRSIWNDVPDSLSTGKNAISYDRVDTFEVRVLVRNLSDQQVDNVTINENFRGYFGFVDVVTPGVTNSVNGTMLTLSGITMAPRSEKEIVYRLKTPKETDPVHASVNNYLAWQTYIYASVGNISYYDAEGKNSFVKYRNYADMMFSAKLAADADLNWKNFLGLYYQPFKVFMIMENKERTPAVGTKYVQYIPKDVPFYWTDNSIDIPILRTPGGKFVDVLKGSNDQNKPEYDMDGDGHPDVWLDTASIYPKGYTITEDSVYWLNPWEHLRSGDSTYYEDINHDGKRALDINGDGIVDIEAPGDKIRVWKVTWDIGKVAGYEYYDPYCSYEIWVDPPDLVPMAAGVGKAYNRCEDVNGMFYPYAKDIPSANLADTSWKNWMERDDKGNVIWKQLIWQKIHNYEGFTFIDTLKENYRMLPTDKSAGTVPQPHREFIAVLSLGGEEIDMTKPIPNKSLYSNLTYKTIFNESRTTPIRSTYTYYAPLPNPLQFEYLSNNYSITDTKTGDTLKFLPEWGKANITFDVDASTEYSYYWIRNAGHDVLYNDPSWRMERNEKLGDGVFGYMIYDIPKGLGGYKITLPKNADGTYNIKAILEVDGHEFEPWLENSHTKDSVEIWEDQYQYHVYIPQLLIPPALDDDNHDGIDDWIDDRGDRFSSSTGFLHDPFMLDDGEMWRNYPTVPFQDDIYGRVDSGWYCGPDGVYGDDFYEDLGKTHFKIHCLYEGMGKEGPIEISKGGWLVVEEIFGGSPWVLFSHTLSGYAKGVDYKITSQPLPSVVKYGVDTVYIKHTIRDATEPHKFDINFDPYHVSYGYGESTITTYAGGKDPCNLLLPAIDMTTIIDPSFNHKDNITLIPSADSKNPELSGYPKHVSGTFLEVRVEVMNGTDDNWLNTSVTPKLPANLKNSQVVMSYVAYPRPLVPAKVDPATGKVIQGGDDIGAFKAGWRFNQPEGEVLIKMGNKLPLLQPSRRAYFVYLLSVDETLDKGVYNIDFTMDGDRVHYDGTKKGSIAYEVPSCYFSRATRNSAGTVTDYQKFVLGTGNLEDLKTRMTNYFSGLENVKWSLQDINQNNFDTLKNSLPAKFVIGDTTRIETIDLSQFKNFPSVDTTAIYLLEKAKTYSYGANDKFDITTTEDLSFNQPVYGEGMSSAGKMTVATFGPKIGLYKRVVSINGKMFKEWDTLKLDNTNRRDLCVMLQVMNLGNDINENTLLKIYPGSSFDIIQDSLPQGCAVNNGIIEASAGSFIPGQTKTLYLWFQPSPTACRYIFDTSSVIKSVNISYKGSNGRDNFAYPDNLVLDFPAPDFGMVDLTADLASIHRGSTVALTASFRNGLLAEKGVNIGIYAVINGTDTTVLGQKMLSDFEKAENSSFNVSFTIPDTVNYITFFARIDDGNNLCEFCENNNVQSLNLPFRGPNWILNVNNTPNPIDYWTDMIYTLPKSVNNVRITMYDWNGRVVGTFDNCPASVGVHNMHLLLPNLAKGAYMYRISGNDEQGKLEDYTGSMIKE